MDVSREPVILNIYDMFWTNDYTATLGVGVYHSGLEVYGREYAYGGHPFPFSGIFDISPREAGELGEQFRYKQSLHLGNTDFTQLEVEKIIEQLGKEYRGDRYHLMNRNCNHFTGAFSQILTGRYKISFNKYFNIFKTHLITEMYISFNQYSTLLKCI